jgi:hypothetical protein
MEYLFPLLPVYHHTPRSLSETQTLLPETFPLFFFYLFS